MGKPTARICDMHTCPVATPVPHIGGPVTGPGARSVLISGLPAAKVGDTCTCTGAIDSIVTGASHVLIEGRPAVRKGDRCAHGGSITTGCSTVLIGISIYGKDKDRHAKKRSRKPSPARRIKLINQAIQDASQLLTLKLKGIKRRDTATMKLFKKWFGRDDEKAIAIISIRIRKELRLIKNLNETHFSEIPDRETRMSAFAMVYANDRGHIIYLGNQFWLAAALGPDSRAGTLVHEASHFLDIGETRDFEYGDARCLMLAKFSPDKALYNADNFERFIES